MFSRRRATAGRVLGETADLSGAVGNQPPVAGGHRGRHVGGGCVLLPARDQAHVVVRTHQDRKSTRLNSSHSQISYAVFCLKKKKKIKLAEQTILRQIHIFV